MTNAPVGGTVLSLEGITRRFGSVVALNEATLHVRAGTVHAVLGENGAGKTTLMRVAFGLLQPNAGTIRVGGVVRTIPSPAAALSLGIGMVHQHFTLVPAMTVAENVALGGHGLFDPRTASARVHEVASHAGLSLDAEAVVGTLPIGAQQRCEIVKALARNVQLLILDEPTAVLAPSEAAELLGWIRRHADAGHAVVLITHKLRDALAIADDVSVLRGGRTVLAAPAASITETDLANAMLGNDAASADKAAADKAAADKFSAADGVWTAAARAAASIREARGAPVLIAESIGAADERGVQRVRGATLRVHAGEIVGIAAVEGAGQRELLRVLAGRSAATSGTLTRPDVVGFIPEDRHQDALLLDSSLVENVALRGAGARGGRMPWSALRNTATAIVQQYRVRASGVESVARALSGGNQQKLVLGRELHDPPSALVVENPSRGLDFRATAAVRDALLKARDDGVAVVVYSSDLDEVLMLADRVYAMHDGRLTETPRDRDMVGRAMLGSTRAPG